MSVVQRISATLRQFSYRSIPKSRGYGSAAAVQVDYDYDYNEDEDESRYVRGNRGIEELGKWENIGRGVQWVIMGDPIVNRHMYAERLAKLLEVPHISMGTLVRQELNPNSPLYKQISDAVNKGKLVPEDVIFGLLSKRLEDGYHNGETGFILDGIPRTRIQAEILDQIADIDLVLNLKCLEESLVKKTIANGMYSPSKEFRYMPSSGFSICLEREPSHLPSSISDSDSIWKEKLRLHAELRKPLEEYYKRQNKLLDFQVAGAPGDTWNGLLAALQLSNSSQKLTV